MKFPDGGLRRRFSAARLALRVILVAVATLGLATPSRADGLYTHTEIVERAICKLIKADNLDPQHDYSELTDILQEYRGIVNYGALFPDIATVIAPDWGEVVADSTDLRNYWIQYGPPSHDAHTQPPRQIPSFRAALMAQLLDNYKNSPRTEQDKKLLAFMFGLISHQEADLAWHPFGGIPFNNDNALETKIPSGWNELLIDMLLVRYDECQSNLVAFSFLTDDLKQVIQAACQQLTPPAPMPSTLDTGEYGLEALWALASRCLPFDAPEVHGLVENGGGGIKDAAAHTAVAWIETWDAMKDPPAITPQVTGTLGANGWYTSDVTVTWTVLDPESPVTSQTGCEATTITEDTAGVTLTCTACSAGGTASQSVTIKRDATPPTITLLVPGEGAEYLLYAQVLADWSVSDALSGVDEASATVDPNLPIDTATVGFKSFDVTATDMAGNTSTQSVTYDVCYDYSGLAPIRGTGPDEIPEVKLGSASPLKFQLFDANGDVVEDAVVRLYLAPIVDGLPDLPNEIPAPQKGSSPRHSGNVFRYDPVSEQYIFNLDTRDLAPGDWQLRIEFDDGRSFTAIITVH